MLATLYVALRMLHSNVWCVRHNAVACAPLRRTYEAMCVKCIISRCVANCVICLGSLSQVTPWSLLARLFTSSLACLLACFFLATNLRTFGNSTHKRSNTKHRVQSVASELLCNSRLHLGDTRTGHDMSLCSWLASLVSGCGCVCDAVVVFLVVVVVLVFLSFSNQLNSTITTKNHITFILFPFLQQNLLDTRLEQQQRRKWLSQSLL